ncbi:OmpA family protein [Croceivirga sp. JEA036]|uniref:OmpA family protein n=1 Tax=Croceivirga sp. JEA036 TaxID=2721162 RepID=UPI00143C77A3|nr:OmpA family protein [Croceivirga sp. JEA036]NJB35357.1 OmpA family protein [Croceivirga sp. JEA036]
MKNVKNISLALVMVMVSTCFVQAQEEIPVLTKKDTIVLSSWIVGVGMNAVDDAGSEFSDVLNFSDNWNVVPHPSRLSIGRYFKNGLGLEAIGSYNKYQEGKVVDGLVVTEESDYYAVDFRVNYDLNKILGETGFFDPYVGIGAGYTEANNQGRGTYNANVGFRTWISDNWGLDFSSTGKWTMNKENSTNHIQHAAGVVYRFGIEKGLSLKGEEKLALINEMQAEQQRLNDSIAAAEKAKREARELAERLKREEEQAKLAAAEKAKQDALQAKKDALRNAIDDLGLVYFNLNSSYLNSESKRTLDKLAVLLQENPSLVLEVSSYTDARGTDTYNQWLSERRVKRTTDYLLAQGVSKASLKTQAFGERQLTNECSDGVYCPESKHRENRRSEFKILEF